MRQDDLTPFSFEGSPLRLMATQQGIWKPRRLQAALSFRTVFASDPSQRPYDDEVGPDGFIRYKWRGVDPTHPDNRALRVAMTLALPLIWFQGVASGVYYPIYPVWLADEESYAQQFVVSLSEEALRVRHDLLDEDPELVRSYAERVVKARLHQPLFRQRVLLCLREPMLDLPSSSHASFSTQPTSWPTQKGVSPSSPTASPCARSITPPMTQTSSALTPSTSWGSALMS